MDSNNTTPLEAKDDTLQDMTVTQTGDMEKAADTVGQTQPAPPQSVMDVNPPPQDNFTPVAAPVEAAPEIDTSDAPLATSPEPVQPLPQEQVILPTGTETVEVNNIPKKSSKGLVVAIAVVLALVLASIALLVFMKANKTAKSSDDSVTAPSSSQTASKDETKTPVTANDVDAVTTDVDSTISALDENKDFSADSLSDKTLGLQ